MSPPPHPSAELEGRPPAATDAKAGKKAKASAQAPGHVHGFPAVGDDSAGCGGGFGPSPNGEEEEEEGGNGTGKGNSKKPYGGRVSGACLSFSLPS